MRSLLAFRILSRESGERIDDGVGRCEPAHRVVTWSPMTGHANVTQESRMGVNLHSGLTGQFTRGRLA